MLARQYTGVRSNLKLGGKAYRQFRKQAAGLRVGSLHSELGADFPTDLSIRSYGAEFGTGENTKVVSARHGLSTQSIKEL